MSVGSVPASVGTIYQPTRAVALDLRPPLRCAAVLAALVATEFLQHAQADTYVKAS